VVYWVLPSAAIEFCDRLSIYVPADNYFGFSGRISYSEQPDYKSFLFYLKNRSHGNQCFTSFYVKQILCYSVVFWQVNT